MDPQPRTQSLKKSSLVIIPMKNYDEYSEQCVMHLSIGLLLAAAAHKRS